MDQQFKIGNHATTTGVDNDGFFTVRYHSTDVFKYHPGTGQVVLNSGGWRTATTKKRINQAANQLGLNFQIFQKNFDWFVRYFIEGVPEDNEPPFIAKETIFDFYDGFKLNLKTGQEIL